jgi:hypothetical protein
MNKVEGGGGERNQGATFICFAQDVQSLTLLHTVSLFICLRSDVLTAIIVFWDVTPCSLVCCVHVPGFVEMKAVVW